MDGDQSLFPTSVSEESTLAICHFQAKLSPPHGSVPALHSDWSLCSYGYTRNNIHTNLQRVIHTLAQVF